MSNARRSIYLLPLVLGALGMADDAAAQSCPTMRKINIGVAVAPPNVPEAFDKVSVLAPDVLNASDLYPWRNFTTARPFASNE